MTSSVGWLDASAADERRMREIVRLFSTTESRDELGLGQVRDALSQILFPATSVVQTRARYFLIVPWLIAHAATRRRKGRTIIQDVHARERALISHFLEHHNEPGLIGRVAGPKVRILPSTIYWSGLTDLGIVPSEAGRVGLDDWLANVGSTAAARRALADLPEPPDDFPAGCTGGFELTSTEAGWLRDRIAIGSTGSSLYAHLAKTDTAPAGDARFAWQEPGVLDAPAENQRQLRHAEHFSLIAEGAALVYNVQLAEMCDDLGINHEWVEGYQDEVARWLSDVERDRERLMDWDLDDFWSTVLESNPRIGALTRAFVREWISLIRDADDVARSVGSDDARRIVMRREIQQKKGQSRFRNEKMLHSYSGAAGTGRLDFRWGTVRTHLTDLHTGLGHAAT